MQKIIKFITLFIIIFILGIFYISLNRSSNYDTEYLIGNKLNEIKLSNFYNDNSYTNSDFKKNNYTLINFWASWCAPCRTEHPFLMQLNEEKNLQLLGINFKDRKKNAMEFLKELGNPYDYLAKDNKGKQSINFGIYGVPESILVDSEFIILKKFIGPLSEEDVEEIKKIIN
ncbi:MAG: DsbE family thiol:disulfide interchange protein [Pseudomonadota bacterium]|nr:DsbE family thiol:disulfide interchange protein [Pseudomonadota bacterium]